MQPTDYIAQQPEERQALLIAIHKTIVATDKSINAIVEPMMGKDMILYKAKGMMKYGLSSVKNYISLHVLPMYMNPKIYDQYKSLLPLASFQKGCINFMNAKQLPVEIVKKLIADCALIDLHKVREEQLQARKQAKKK